MRSSQRASQLHFSGSIIHAPRPTPPSVCARIRPKHDLAQGGKGLSRACGANTSKKNIMINAKNKISRERTEQGLKMVGRLSKQKQKSKYEKQIGLSRACGARIENGGHTFVGKPSQARVCTSHWAAESRGNPVILPLD